MIGPVFPIIGGLLVLLFWLIFAFKKALSPSRILCVSLMILYVTAVVCLTLFPINYEESRTKSYNVIDNQLRLIPLGSTIDMLTNCIPLLCIVQIGGNFLMTIPFGILMPLVFKNKKLLFYIISFILFTVIIEFSQFMIGLCIGSFYRTTDIDDVIINSIGAMAGYGIYLLIPSRIKNKLKK